MREGYGERFCTYTVLLYCTMETEKIHKLKETYVQRKRDRERDIYSKRKRHIFKEKETEIQREGDREIDRD